MISHRYKCIFLHIPKAAGTSIERLLSGADIDIPQKVPRKRGFSHFLNEHLDYYVFSVVRNPYDRILSEFYCKFGGIMNTKHIYDKFDVHDFNNYIKEKLLKRSKTGDHYTEQYKYLDQNTNIHIIHYENLHTEFDELMKKYNLHIKIDKHSNKSTLNKKFTVESFSPEIIKLINEIYHKDFEMFDYQRNI